MQTHVHVLRQIDVGDSLDLDLVARLLGTRELTRGATLLRGPRPSPSAGVVLRREPLDLKLGQVEVASFTAEVRARMFDFGVIAIRFTFSLTDVTSSEFIDLSNRIAVESATFDAQARRIWLDLSAQVREALVPWEETKASQLIEDFTVFVLPTMPEGDLGTDRILAHALLGEPAHRRIAASTVQELSRRAIRYYEDDLVLVDYDTAIVVDKEGATDLVDIFEIASAQVLELRFYDALLGRSLEALLRDVRRARTAAWLLRSPFRALARRAAVLALELGQMTDRLERAITLVGDTYSAQIYRETSVRFRLAEAGASAREKVSMIDRVSEALGYEIHARRDLALEFLVILLIAIEVVIAFRTGH